MNATETHRREAEALAKWASEADNAISAQNRATRSIAHSLLALVALLSDDVEVSR